MLVVEGMGTERNGRISKGFRNQDPQALVIQLMSRMREGHVKDYNQISFLPINSTHAQ